MPRGGARPGAGRPRKDRGAKTDPVLKQTGPSAIKSKDQTPLEFMLSVMNDATEDLKFRAQMAQAAAPYVHGKPGDEKKGKKEETQERANAIGRRFGAMGPPTLKAVS